jgi:hypothetical protein
MSRLVRQFVVTSLGIMMLYAAAVTMDRPTAAVDSDATCCRLDTECGDGRICCPYFNLGARPCSPGEQMDYCRTPEVCYGIEVEQ